jgi:hypothetical protein
MTFCQKWVMDMNFSLKWMATMIDHSIGNTQVPNSDYILCQAFVNQFSDEIPPQQEPLETEDALDNSVSDEFTIDEGGPADGPLDSAMVPCTDH